MKVLISVVEGWNDCVLFLKFQEEFDIGVLLIDLKIKIEQKFYVGSN